MERMAERERARPGEPVAPAVFLIAAPQGQEETEEGVPTMAPERMEQERMVEKVGVCLPPVRAEPEEGPVGVVMMVLSQPKAVVAAAAVPEVVVAAVVAAIIGCHLAGVWRPAVAVAEEAVPPA